MQQHAVVVTHYNPADPASTLYVVEKPMPEPKAGEVLVKVTARPINPADVFSVMGVYPGFTPKQLPGSLTALFNVLIVSDAWSGRMRRGGQGWRRIQGRAARHCLF